MKTILLNPGPVSLSEGVRAALSRPDLCHREAEFSELQQSIRDQLLRVYELATETWASVLLTGSGTAAVEAMLATLCPRDQQVLIIENGVYGERMRRMVDAYGISAESHHQAWGGALDIQSIGARLEQGDFSHVVVVHHETTTGRLNDLAALAEVCLTSDTRMLIDGVSSFGAELIDFDNWPIDAVAATANKCLHGVPGTAFVVASREALSKAVSGRSVYLDLSDYLSKQDAGGTPFTQSVQTFYALDKALQEFFDQGGWQARQQLFRQRMHTVRTTLAELGVTAVLPVDETSCVLHAFELPEGRDYATVHAALKARGFIIYAGQGQLSETVFRISAMGDINSNDMARLQQALREVIAT